MINYETKNWDGIRYTSDEVLFIVVDLNDKSEIHPCKRYYHYQTESFPMKNSVTHTCQTA